MDEDPRYAIALASGGAAVVKVVITNPAVVRPPRGSSSFGLVRFQQLLEDVLGRHVDVVEYGGLKTFVDDDIRREAVRL